jgi:hypothetical protein
MDKPAALAMVQAYKDACKLRDKFTLDAASKVEPALSPDSRIGFRCPAAAG